MKMITKKNLVIASLIIPVGAMLALFAYALAKSGGAPGGLVVNSSFGEINVEERAAPQFAYQTLDGEAVNLSDLRGKIVMIDFWSSWCPPCRVEAPELASAYEEYKDRGVEFVGVAIWDDPGQVKAFLERHNISYINGVDDNGNIAIDYGVRGIPEKYFIDTEGSLVRKFVGPMTEDKLGEILDEMLAQAVVTRD